MPSKNWFYVIGFVMIPIGIMAYWFGWADRQEIFLYNHLGFTPFSKITQGRYWMSGLVASGFILAIGIVIFSLLKYWKDSWMPTWKTLMISVAPVLFLGSLYVTTQLGTPTLSIHLGIKIGIITMLAGLCVLVVLSHIHYSYSSFLLTALDGFSLVPMLMFLKVVELPSVGIKIPPAQALTYSLGSFLISALILIVVSIIRYVFKINQAITWYETALFGFVASYIGLPFIHYLWFTPTFTKYISAAEMFFADSWLLQLSIMVLAAGLVRMVVWTRLDLQISQKKAKKK